jgi:DNA mismatch repair protein MutS
MEPRPQQSEPGDGPQTYPSLLFESASATQPPAADQEDSFARDLNFDQIVAAIAGKREQRELITNVLLGNLRDTDTVRYRQEIFQDLADPALFEQVTRFAELMSQVRAHLGQLAKMQYRYHREGWFLDAAAIYCDAVGSFADQLAAARIKSRGLLAFRDYLASYVATAGFIKLESETRDRREALGRIRYCTRIRGSRVDVSRYQDEADYSAEVLRTFDRLSRAQSRTTRCATGPGRG